MGIQTEQIFADALALPPDERALLADRLVESIDPAADEAFRLMWAEEAGRRLEDLRSGRVQAVPGDEALARVRRALTQ